MAFNPRDEDFRESPTRDQATPGRISPVYRADTEPGRARTERLIDEDMFEEDPAFFNDILSSAAVIFGLAATPIAAKYLRSLLPRSVIRDVQETYVRKLYDFASGSAKTEFRGDNLGIIAEAKSIINQLDTGASTQLRADVLEELKKKYVSVNSRGARSVTLGEVLRTDTKNKFKSGGVINELAAKLNTSSSDISNLSIPGLYTRSSKVTSFADIRDLSKFDPINIGKRALRGVSEFEVPFIGLRPFSSIIPSNTYDDVPTLLAFRDPVSIAKYGEGKYDTLFRLGSGKTYGVGATTEVLDKSFDVTSSQAIARVDASRVLDGRHVSTSIFGNPIKVGKAGAYDDLIAQGELNPSSPTFYRRLASLGIKDIDAPDSPSKFLEQLIHKLSIGKKAGVKELGKDEFANYGGARNVLAGLDGTSKGNLSLIDKKSFLSNTLNASVDVATTSVFKPFFGYDIKPGKNAASTLFKSIVGYGGPAYLAYEGAGYANYLVGAATGIEPTDVVADAYAGTRVAQSQLAQGVGITSLAQSAEAEFPGILDSQLATGVRTFGLLFAGAALGSKLGGSALRSGPLRGASSGAAIGLAGGAAASALLFPDMAESAEDVEARYAGAKWEPVRAGQYWSLGRTPYEGGQIRHFLPNWTVREKSEYRMKSIYGSEDAYWAKGSLLPTPHNALLARKLLDPYYVERENYFQRPYPVTSPMGGDIPVFGPLIEATLGSALKPRLYRSGFEDLSYAAVGGDGSSGEYQIKSVGGVPGTFESTLADVENIVGLKGYYSELLRGSISSTQEGQIPLAESGSIESFGRYYFDSELFGGGMGTTEAFRRFLTRYSREDTYNPIRNTMPEWLPGEGEVRDFQHGDPYAFIREGEARLPGSGYEALMPLFGENNYSIVDQFFILADVAPWSTGFNISKQSVENMILEGRLPPFYLYRYNAVLQQIEDKKYKVNAESGRNEAELRDLQVTIDQVISEREFITSTGEYVQLSNVPGRAKQAALAQMAASEDHLALKASGNEGPALRKLNAANEKLYDYLMGMRGKQITLSAPRDQGEAYSQGKLQATYSGYTSMAEDLNVPLEEQYYDPSIAGDVYRESGNWVGEALGVAGAALGSYFGKSPLQKLAMGAASGFVGWAGGGLFEQKFTAQYDPAEAYEEFNLRGNEFAGWNDPISNFLRTWTHQLLGTILGEGYVPGYREEQRRVETYFDLLKYEKYSRLESKARQYNQVQEAGKYQAIKQQTAIYQTGQSVLGTKDAIFPSERKYFNMFVNSGSDRERLKILASTTEQMKIMLLRAWKREIGHKDFANAQVQAYYEQYVHNRDRYNTEQYAQLVADQLGIAFPEPQDRTWSKDIPVDAAKYTFLVKTGRDIHQYGMWNSDAPDMGTLDRVRQREVMAEAYQRRNYQYSSQPRYSELPSRQRTRWEYSGNEDMHDYIKDRSFRGESVFS